ncbi:hypothetical protein AVEN_209337-1 [Araneus ventricosus]|uniref:Uncharacterized protein n=1 Tax=Araneus ventricosus TaxID=182803 RepID=A0A4Y2CCK1_ARAVE|nr:hypothetical protein AVEN_209337-1 [Araneus ventricosus]
MFLYILDEIKTLNLFRGGKYEETFRTKLMARNISRLNPIHSQVFGHLERFSANLGDIHKAQGERFDQDIMAMVDECQSRWDIHIANYYWNLQRCCVNKLHSRM